MTFLSNLSAYTVPALGPALERKSVRPDEDPLRNGVLIVNADDWGRDVDTTDRSLDCVLREAVSSVSAMVFMEDSERAAVLAQVHAVDAGFHLNLTTPFSAPQCSSRLIEHQQKLSRFLRSHRLAPFMYHPGLAASFEYVVRAQLEEFERLYGALPNRVDGHHHMHLCANVLRQKLLPAGTIVRRNFSFGSREKGYLNRLYRRWQDRRLAQRHRLADFFFSLPPLDPRRMERIFGLASRFSVEVETHPVNPEEYRFLIDGELIRCAGKVAVAQGYLLRPGNRAAEAGYCVNQTGASANRAKIAASMDSFSSAPGQDIPHICVCICTYQRPLMLKHLLTELNRQETGGLFTYSAVVADNDQAKSAEAVVAEFRSISTVSVKYCVEPRQSIALARNTVVENAEGAFVAFIDDDEFPTPDWLRTLFNTCNEYKVDGVLGPVKRHFDEVPPTWIEKSRFYDRRVNPTGMRVDWHEARTGNVLLKRQMVIGDPAPFRPEFRAGEDQDFFRRKIEEGRVFIWSAEAEVFEVVPPARWKRLYLLRKALLRGATASLQPGCGAGSIAKSMIAVPLYALALPFAQLLGHHRFMTLLVKLCDHLGKLLMLVGINPIREEYV